MGQMQALLLSWMIDYLFVFKSGVVVSEINKKEDKSREGEQEKTGK